MSLQFYIFQSFSLIEINTILKRKIFLPTKFSNVRSVIYVFVLQTRVTKQFTYHEDMRLAKFKFQTVLVLKALRNE